MIKHLKRFVAITISLVMAFQFSTNSLYTYAQTEDVVEPTQTEVSTKSDSTATEQPVEPSETVEGAADTTTPPETGTDTTEPAPDTGTTPETQPAEPQQEITLKVEFVDANNAPVKDSVEQALNSKGVGDTIRLEDLSIETNIEGYTLTEVKDKNDNTQVYTTETKDFVLTGNVTELQFVYTQNVQTDQLEETEDSNAQQGDQENQNEKTNIEDKANEVAKTLFTMTQLLRQNSNETINVLIDGVSDQKDYDIQVGLISDHAPSFTNYTYEYATIGEDGPKVVSVGVYKIGDETYEYYSTDGKSAQLIGNNKIVLHYSSNSFHIQYKVNPDAYCGKIVGPENSKPGDMVSFYVESALGYEIKDVKIDGQSVYSEGKDVYTFEMPFSEPQIEVEFEKAHSYKVSYIPLGNSKQYNYHDHFGDRCDTPTEVEVLNGETFLSEYSKVAEPSNPTK